MRTRARIVILAVALAVAAQSAPIPAQQAPIGWSEYVHHIVRLLEEHSVLRYEIDWTAFRVRVDAIMAPYNLEIEAERYEVLRQVFALLRNHCDVHSSYCPLGTLEEERAAWADGRIPHAPGEGLANPYGIDARMLDGGIGYVSIPRTFPDPLLGVPEAAPGMGLELLRLVRLLDAKQPAGWVIDLRGDRGGCLWTRWIGFHPFLAPGCLFGNAVPVPDSPPKLTRWTSFRDGLFTEVSVDSEGVQSESMTADLGSDRYTLSNPAAPIAVLIGETTASAGEYTALALRQNPRVRVFGQASLGATTAIDGFELEDGSLLLVATQYMVDPLGHVFASATRAPWATGSRLSTGNCVAEPLRPDVLIPLQKPLSAAAQDRMTPDQILAYLGADPVLDAALAWLRETQTSSSVDAVTTP
ncbi:MAG: S41 family peptidase [Candidatus Bipolaricaulis sp.]|nr:S41 family peptidase [Candidatus Bipolaricaulis sp.]